MPDGSAGALARLEALGLVSPRAGRPRTTRRFQAAMARAALGLVRTGETRDDLRVPIAVALFELLGADAEHEDLEQLVEAMLPIEAAELVPEPVRGG